MNESTTITIELKLTPEQEARLKKDVSTIKAWGGDITPAVLATALLAQLQNAVSNPALEIAEVLLDAENFVGFKAHVDEELQLLRAAIIICVNKV